MRKNIKNYIKDDKTSEYIRYNPLLDARIKHLEKELKQVRLVRLLAICVFATSAIINLIKCNYFSMIVSLSYLIIALTLSANCIRSLSEDLKQEQSKITKFKVIK